MDIIIFDDDSSHNKRCSDIVNQLNEDGVIYNLQCVTTSPMDVKNYVTNSQTESVYLLDIVVGKILTGFSLAKLINSQNPRNIIVFMTSYPVAIIYQSRYKLISSNIILKSAHFEEELIYTLKHINKLISEVGILKFYSKEYGFFSFTYDEILYFESIKNSHTIALHHTEGMTTLNSSLNKIETLLDDTFFRCHGSFIINLKKIKQVDTKRKNLVLRGGLTCPISYTGMKKYKSIMGNLDL